MRIHLSTLGLTILLCIVAGCGDKTLTLVRDGRAKAVVLVGPEADPPVHHAAEELVHFVKRMSGATLRRVHEPSDEAINIAVGPEAAKMLDPSFGTTGLGADGIAMRSVGRRGLILAGQGQRGTLYAVYTLLEDHWGCRWWGPDASTIPRQATLRLPTDLNHQYTPPLEYRYPFWTEAFDPDWAVRNKANGSNRLDERRGGFTGHGGVHTFYRLIPPKQYFPKHPEWFSLLHGKRTAERAQLCLSNMAMQDELVKNLVEHIRRHPHPPVYSVSQNDWRGYCTCAKCQALADRYGGQSGLMVWFVNRVAERIEKEFPDATISTLAYQYTRQPPENIRPRRNVVIQLCSIECSFSVPLTHERNAAFRDDIIGWSKTADRLYIWDYTTNFRHHFMPHPNLRVLGPNVRFFVDHHARGIFEQGAYTTLGAEFGELRAWVLAKLLWNPRLDDRELIRTFCDGYYGPAAPHILQYIDLIHDAAAKAEEPAVCLPSYKRRFDFLTFEVMSRAWQCLAEAERAVKDKLEYAVRIEKAELPVMYAFLWRWPELRAGAEAQGAAWPVDRDITALADRFKTIARQHNVTRVNEWHEGFGLVDRAVEQAKRASP